VDAFRGAIMLLMAIDHIRDYVARSAQQFLPTDLTRTTPAIFFTRWITLFCAPVRRDMKLEGGKAFHSFRRFRAAHLRKNRVPWDLQKLWLGHANKDVTDRYAEQLKEDVEWRKHQSSKNRS